MRSLFFVVATLLVARLTAVPFDRNSHSFQDPNLHSDDRVTVNIGAAASPPLIIGSGKSVNVTSNGGITSTFGSTNRDPATVAKSDQSQNMSNLTRSDRAYVGTINSDKTVVFKKRGSVDVNSRTEAQQPSEASNLTRSDRAIIGNFNSLSTDYYNQGRVLSAQPYAAMTQLQSFSSDYQQPSAAFYLSQADPYFASYSSTAERVGALAGQQLSSDSFYITETHSNSGGVPTIQRTVIFKKRGANPPSTNVGKTGQVSEHVGSVNGSLSA